MKYIGTILLMSASFVYGVMFLAMFIGGITKREVYYVCTSPPIVFGDKPIKFVLWCLCLVALATACLFMSGALALEAMEKL